MSRAAKILELSRLKIAEIAAEERPPLADKNASQGHLNRSRQKVKRWLDFHCDPVKKRARTTGQRTTTKGFYYPHHRYLPAINISSYIILILKLI